ncbi:hypothetical protein TIFTF001_032687 [Ficus carica]|uniref:CL1 n=1 Tax=Ficus carica TaxID=3494 RepID=A0AA88DX65_FICCA|nr:hypothetical protein TIFTF001_032687 [Ficus carica]
MASRRLLSEARRHCLARPPFHLRPHRFLCSSSPPPPESDPNPSAAEESSRRRSPGPGPLQPVSYAIKPKGQSPPPSEEPPTPSPLPPEAAQRPRWPRDSPSEEFRSTWTREDVRFVKDAPSIAPVSYPTRVAPLPEDKVSAEADGGSGEKPVAAAASESEERRRIEMTTRLRRRSSFSRVSLEAEEEEKVVVPFPTQIKVEKKERKPILDLMEAIRQVKANAECNFDETVEAHVRLGIDAKRAGRGVRGSMILPHGGRKVVRVAVFAEGRHADEARAAGADIVGGVELIEEVAMGCKSCSNKLNVDKCFATNEMIRRMAKISRILIERGLWPDPKLGTVTNDVSEALKKVRQGHIEFKMDKTAIVHVGVGKVSYSEEYIRENIGAFANALLLAKPAGLKKSIRMNYSCGNVYFTSSLSQVQYISLELGSVQLANDANS